MTVVQLRRQLKDRIDQLPKDRLRSAADFLEFLEESPNPAALGMRRRLRAAEREVALGKLTPVARLRRKY